MSGHPLLSLAARVESASGADRELEAEIWCNEHGAKLDNIDASGFSYYVPEYAGPCWQHRIEYTASLDAAMSLVPEPGKWSITAGHDGDWQACVWLVDGLDLDWRSAATPALALTAASLRALAGGK